MSSKENQTPPKKTDVDMSERAVTGRLEMVRALYKLGISLKSARLVDAKPVR